VISQYIRSIPSSSYPPPKYVKFLKLNNHRISGSQPLKNSVADQGSRSLLKKQPSFAKLKVKQINPTFSETKYEKVELLLA
jgi:hypothetical protein